MKYQILVVDDEPANLRTIERLFRNDHVVLTAESGEEALSLLGEYDVALIISDQRMPGMTGIDFLKRAAVVRPQTVRIILTGYTDVDDLVAAINSGVVYKYVTKPWVNEELRQTVIRAIEYYDVNKKQHSLRLENERLTTRIDKMVKRFVFAVGEIASQKVLGVGEHCKRTAEYAEAIGLAVGMPPDEIEQLKYATQLHEIVHLNFPVDVDMFSAKLTPEQYRLLKNNYERSLSLISGIPELDEAALIVRYQHEFFDGHGFFAGLEGDQIPLGSRILAAADTIDEIEAGLKPTLFSSDTDPIEWLRARSGTEFDPEIVDACAEIKLQSVHAPASFAVPATNLAGAVLAAD